jgi:hypothetical protein
MAVAGHRHDAELGDFGELLPIELPFLLKVLLIVITVVLALVSDSHLVKFLTIFEELKWLAKFFCFLFRQFLYFAHLNFYQYLKFSIINRNNFLLPFYLFFHCSLAFAHGFGECPGCICRPMRRYSGGLRQ